MTHRQLWVAAFLLNSLWQVPLVCAAGWLASQAVRRIGAAAQHRVWVCASLVQTLLPVCSTSFRMQWGSLRIFQLWHHHTGADAHVSVMLGAGSAGPDAFSLPGLLGAFAAVYGAAIAYLAARYAWRCAAVSALRREARPLLLTDEAALRWTKASQRFGINDASLAVSSRVSSPATIGMRRKLLLLPDSIAGRLTGSELDAVSAHECAHMRRNDFVKNLVYELFALPVLYHPLASYTHARLAESREMVCDEMTAQAIGRGVYARSLLRLASLLLTGMPVRVPHALGIFEAYTLERRLMRITETKPAVQRAQRLAILSACAVLGMGTCTSALALGLHAAAPINNNATKKSVPGRMSLPAEAVAGQILLKVQPRYPEAAKKAKVQGTVLLNAVIGEDGVVERLRVVSGPEELRPSSLDAVRQWTYRPFLLNGDPVEVATTVTVTYTLAP